MKILPLLSLRFLWAGLFGLALMAGCSPASSSGPDGDDVDHYTCTMHPSVRSHDPHGKCPICGMDLVPVYKKNAAASPTPSAAGPKKIKLYKSTMMPGETSPTPAKDSMGMDMVPVYADQPAAGENQPTEFTVPLDRQQLIGVTYATVVRQTLEPSIRVAGLVEAQKQLQWTRVAHTDGYVHALKVFAAGDTVEKGQPIMDIYSPDFVATEKEFIDLLNTQDKAVKNGGGSTPDRTGQLIASIKDRLRQWEISDAQITEIEDSRQPQEYFTVVAPAASIVETLPVTQGQRVAAGDSLATFLDLSSVWVWAQLYQDDLARMDHEPMVKITSDSLPGAELTGKVAIFDHHLDPMTRTARLGIELDNPNLELHPGMYVDVDFPLRPQTGLTVPATAVLPTGKHNVVFVDKGGGKLEPRFVELAGQFGDVDVVTRGLTEGERVVNSANFLIDAESKVQGALQSW
ncbi:MAG TPA: efflux RND transporter periplasmic adaptor subunit [Opitutaceae bacterium]|nr:efflux RND transporter periplasmic adaptor subunit [Opitutaceae bacterium]